MAKQGKKKKTRICKSHEKQYKDLKKCTTTTNRVIFKALKSDGER